MNINTLTILEKMLSDEKISYYLECTKKAYTMTEYDPQYVAFADKADNLYMHTFNATGLTYFFKTLDNYGNQLQDPNYTANVMHTIVENRSYEMLREDLKSIISSIPINNLNQVYQIYKRYSELTEEKILSPKQTIPDINKETKEEEKKGQIEIQKYKKQVWEKIKEIDVLLENPTITNKMLAVRELIDMHEFQSYVCNKGCYTEFAPKIKEYENLVVDFLKQFNVNLTPYDLIKLKNFGPLEDYTKKQNNDAMQIIIFPKQGEPHFDIQKYYGIKQAYLTTFVKHKEQYFDKISRQIGVINNTLNGNFSNITSDNNSRTLLSTLGPDEIQKALIQNLVIEVKNEDPYIVPDLNHLENTLPEYTLTRFANDLTEEKFPYDLNTLNTLNEIAKKTYTPEYNYPNQNIIVR